MQVDASKIEAFMLQLHVMWDGLFQITGYIVILGFLLGWTCLVGLAIIVLAIPVMGKITGKMFGLNRSMVKFTDERVKTVNEAMQGVLCVKMYSWEEPLSKQINSFRHQELSSLKRIAYLRAFTRAYMSALPIIAAATTFFVYVYATDRSVSASILFSSLLAFDMLRMPLMFYPMALAQYAQCKVSLKRVAVFLGHSEVNQRGYTRIIDDAGEIAIENATLYWSDPSKPLPRSALNRVSKLDSIDETSSRGRSISRTSSKSSIAQENTDSEEEDMMFPRPILEGVNIRVKPGELCAIVGPVGSGKSTICASILNEAVLSEGSHVTLKGRVAYVAQTAWILNKTVRDNILFGLPYEEDRYNRVLETCCLTHDLKILEEGDMTEIGERGINLSGGELLCFPMMVLYQFYSIYYCCIGQKQRISVARAAYSNADVFIFDDPLSALDPEVAEKVFDECILGLLKGKTRLLVTNQLQCLTRCDSVVALGKGRRVLEQGTYDELISDKEGEVFRLLKGITPTRKSQKAEKQGTTKKTQNDEAPGAEHKKLMTKEERATGTVKLNVYMKYIQAGGGYLLFSVVFFCFVLSTGANVATSVWVSIWTADSNYENHSE